MKKFIISLICIILGLAFIVTIAYATNVTLIQPDTPIYVTQPYLVPSRSYWLPNGGGYVIIPAYSDIVEPDATPTPTPRPTATPTPSTDPNSAISTDTNNSTTVEDLESDGLIMQIFALINQARMDNELEPLTYNYSLQEAVDTRAQEVSNLFAHDRPSGKNWDTIIAEVDYTVAGENLVQGDKPIATAENLVSAWMNSQSHKDNILNKSFTSTALGLYETDKVIYVVEIFLG